MTVTIDLSGEAIPPSVVTIAKGTKFAGQYENGESYTFSADATYVLPDIGGNVYSATINIIQGTYTTDTFTYNQNIPTAKFILTNPQIDTNQMTVTVRDFVGSSDINEYTVETNITAATADSLIYFIQEESDGNIRIIFGNGTLGKSLADGNVVKVTYLITEGKNGNQVSSFSVNNTIDGYNSSLFVLTDIVKSSGGDDRESIEEIRLNAPKNYQTQNRCVTIQDYKAIILREIANISSVNVWGGETDTPAAFGKTRMAFRTEDGAPLTPRKKQLILDAIEPFNVVTILPEIVDPAQLYLDVVSDVSYDYQKTTLRDADILGLVDPKITAYFAAKLLSFDSVFRYSDFVADIDDADSSILSNSTSIMLTKQHVSTASAVSLQLDYNNAVEAGTFRTEDFVNDSSDTVYLFDDGLGKLFQNINAVNYPTSIGAIAYDTGIATIEGYNFGATNALIRLRAKPVLLDINSERNTLIEEGSHSITITRVL
jgi:hypothetical protein